MWIRNLKPPRILALKPKGIVLPSIHSSMVKAFRSLGLDVEDVTIPDDPEEIFQVSRRSSNHFDAGFLLDLGVDPKFIQNFRKIQLTLEIPWIIWFVDDPEGYGFPDSCVPEWTHAFCWDREIALRLSLEKNRKGKPVFYLPLAADPDIFLPEVPPPDLVYKEGVFIGSTRHENAFLEEAAASVPEVRKMEDEIWGKYSRDLTRSLHDLLWDYLSAAEGKAGERLQQDPLARIWVRAFAFRLGRRKRVEAVTHLLDGGGVFGDEGWREIIPAGYKGGIDYGERVGAVYNRSSFVLDIRQPQGRTGLTQRIFDAGCCEVPVLTEWSPELEILFDPDQELFTYRTIEEGIQKRNEMLRAISAGARRAENLRKRILGKHTYLHRARRILEGLQERIALEAPRSHFPPEGQVF